MMDSRRERRREETLPDINDVQFSINRSIVRCTHDSREFYLHCDGRDQSPKLIEYSLLEMFRSDEQTTSSFLLYFLKKEMSSGFSLSINGQLRGLSTRIMIDVIEHKSLKRAALEHHYITFAAERVRTDSIDTTPDPKISPSIESYDASSMKRVLGQKHGQGRIFERITNLYTSLAESEQTNASMEKEKLDMLETINCLELTIRRLQRNSESEKRDISASKGQITRRMNAVALETANRHNEWKRSESQ